MTDKEKKYEDLLSQVKAFSESEHDEIALMANVAALIHETLNFWWTGFYRVIGQELVLGPFQGPIACTRIPFGRGVCGTAWKEQQTIIVDDVEKFAGHIACSSASKSEIVIPIFKGDKVIAELDIDSDKLSTFDDTDKRYLEEIVKAMRL